MKESLFFCALSVFPIAANAATAIIPSNNFGYDAGSAGLNVNEMYIGYPIPSPTVDDNFYAGPTIDAESFTIYSEAPVIVQDLLSIASNYSLTITVDQQSGTLSPIDMTFNYIEALGALTLSNAASININGSVDVADDLTINAENMTSGTINSTGGNTNISISGALDLNQFTNKSDGSVSIKAGSFSSADGIQNMTGGGNVSILLGGNLSSSGNIENSGSSMEIGRLAQGDVVNISLTNGATMKNDSNSGTITINADSLNISGGASNTASFINSGNLYVTISGETNLAYGFDLSNMQNENVFHLDTGTLVLGGANDDVWTQISANNLNDFFLAVRQGELNLNNVINGENNSNANMNIIAETIAASSVTNNGDSLTLNATTGTEGEGINISSVVSNTNGLMDIISNSDLTIGSVGNVGGVSNSGTMNLQADTINITSISNNNGTLNVLAPTSADGIITVNGNVTNFGGTLSIEAKDISILGVMTNASGTTNITGSDTAGSDLVINAISVSGGTLNLNSLIGGITVNNSLSVSGGSLNVGESITSLTVVNNSVSIDGNVTFSNDAAIGDGNVNVFADNTQGFTMTAENGAITIGGSISVSDTSVARNGTFVADTILVSQDVSSSGMGKLTFGNDASQQITVSGNVSANNGGTIEFFTDDINVGALTGNGNFIVHGSQITADNGGIDIDNGIWFDGTSPKIGMVVNGTDELTLKTDNNAIEIAGGISISNGNTLNLDSATSTLISGIVNNFGVLNVDSDTGVTVYNSLTNNGTLVINGQSITLADVTNNASASFASSGNIVLEDVSNSSDLDISGAEISAGVFSNLSGTTDINASTSFSADFLNVNDGGIININTEDIVISNSVHLVGSMVQGGGSGALNLIGNNFTLSAESLSVTGDVSLLGGTADYVINNQINITGDVDVVAGAVANINANNFVAQNFNNAGNVVLNSTNGISLGTVSNNGSLVFNSGMDAITVDSFVSQAGGTTVFEGQNLIANGDFSIANTLYQNYSGTLNSGEANINSEKYIITASNFSVAGINQETGNLIINSSDVTIDGNINADNIEFFANPKENWMNVKVAGSISGGANFIGLEQMVVGGNYVFDNNSLLNVAILPTSSISSDYWASVSLNEDNSFGAITNAEGGNALISVGGNFISDVTGFGNPSDNSKLQEGQIGISLFDIVDQGTAIWLVHSDKGIVELNDKIRNLNVNFCNADGTICFDYLSALDAYNGSNGENLPAYLSLRDTDNDGVADSIYVVFDPQFGGPVEIFKLQPVVNRVASHTNGEFVSAGAIDNLISSQLANTGFFNKTPIEAIPVIFNGTNLEIMAQELYDRMEYYNLNRDGSTLARFSRLFQPRELEQIAGAISLNEHTNFRSFEDRMFDEFIWNRNRSLKKAWLDFDIGLFSQNASDDKRINGNRFNLSGGFDWQHSETMILGLTGRISNTYGNNSDFVDLSYAGNTVSGFVDLSVSGVNFGVGGYLIKILGEKTRLYGNAFIDLHLFDVTRDQTFVAPIEGNGTAFSLISEWGLLHDWLNQYIVGNMYARVGYNFGLSANETAGGQDYMDFESDGYLIFTPGYSLIAQKRIYPSVWFQIRPYASIGMEYDVLGAPDFIKYKFALSNSYTKYDINIDPLWANIGAGIEFLSATGIQVGLDYRYQYNQDIQLHNIKISGSYRF